MFSKMRMFALLSLCLTMLMTTAAVGGPALFASVGVENPAGTAGNDGDLVTRWSGGLETMHGETGEWILRGKFTQAGWGQDDVEDETRWNYGVGYLLESYWPDARPFVMLGLEHVGGSFLIDQVNQTWLAVGVQPDLPWGWAHVAYEASGFAQAEQETCHRIVIDFVTGKSQVPKEQ